MQTPGPVNRRLCTKALAEYTGGGLLKFLYSRSELNATEVTYAYWHVWFAGNNAGIAAPEKVDNVVPVQVAIRNIEFFIENRYSNAEAHVMAAFAERSEVPQFTVDPLIIDNESDP